MAQAASAASSGRKTNLALALSLLLYTAVVHIADTYGFNSDFNRFLSDWAPFRALARHDFDLFKFTAWFLVPFLALVILRRVDWGYFGVKRGRKVDFALLAALAVVGMLAVLSIRIFPSLQEWYPDLGRLPVEVKWRLGTERLIWTFSWIVGWEFIHRYALLTQLGRVWPRFGWLLIPLIEGLYHLQKAPIEAAGMVGLSLVLTAWARHRRNSLLPFLAHFIIEVELLIFQLAM